MSQADSKTTFTLDGREVSPRRTRPSGRSPSAPGTEIPHLCHKAAPGYRADGNCRACMVEIEGERTLAASCIRKPADGMVVKTASERAKEAARWCSSCCWPTSRRARVAHESDSHFWTGRPHRRRRGRIQPLPARSIRRAHPETDDTATRDAGQSRRLHSCNLCVRACREVQVNDVIGMACAADAKIVFDMDDPMGESTCVACGECVQACPTGALMPATMVDDEPARRRRRNPLSTARSTASARSAASAARPSSRSRTTRSARSTARRPGQREPALRQGPLRLRLHPPSAPPDQAADPPRRRAEGPERRPDQPLDPFPRGDLGRGAGRAARRLLASATRWAAAALAGFGSAKGSNEEAYLFQKLVRTGFGTNNVDHCTRLCHASRWRR
jgi:formate dehydrogenase major subunit